MRTQIRGGAQPSCAARLGFGDASRSVGSLPRHAAPSGPTPHRVELRVRKLRNRGYLTRPRIAPSSPPTGPVRARAGRSGCAVVARPPAASYPPRASYGTRPHHVAPYLSLTCPVPPSRLAPRPSATTCAYPEYTPQRYGSDTVDMCPHHHTCTPTNTHTARKRHTTPGR